MSKFIESENINPNLQPRNSIQKDDKKITSLQIHNKVLSFNHNNNINILDDNEFKFDITKKHIFELFSLYELRKFDEEIIRIQLMGGPDKLCSMLKTEVNKGITTNSIPYRETHFDMNLIREERPKTFCRYIIESLSDLMLKILLISAVIQILVGIFLSNHPERDWIDGVSILIAVFIVVFVTSFTNYTKQKKFLVLRETNNKLTKVVIKRNNELLEVNTKSLVVGDVIKLNVGNTVPVDGMILEGNEIKVNESCLTGETELIEKEKHSVCLQLREKERKTKKFTEPSQMNRNKLPSSLIWSGTTVEQGQGWMVALAVGKNSSNGRIMESVLVNLENQTKTPLEDKLNILAIKIGKFGILFALLTLMSLLIRFGVVYSQQLKNYEKDDTKLNPKTNISTSILKIFILVISVLVVAIPEGLPLAVTLSLAFSVQKMMEKNNLVRKLSSCETMGNANFICTDKTGTLTKNKMTVNSVFNCYKTINIKEITGDENNRIEASKFFNETKFDKQISSRSSYLNDEERSYLNEMSSINESEENENEFKYGTDNLKKMNVEGKRSGEENYGNDHDKDNHHDKDKDYKDNDDNDSIHDSNNDSNNDHNNSINDSNHDQQQELQEINQQQEQPSTQKQESWFNYLKLSIALNLELEITENDQINSSSKTDLALFNFLKNFKVEVYPYIKDYLSNDQFKTLPFSSLRKKRSTIVKNSSFPTGYRIFTKGASEIMIEKSISKYLCPRRLIKRSFFKIKFQVENIINKYANECLRTLAIAYKDISEKEFFNYKESFNEGYYNIEEEDLVLISIIGIRDVLRDNVKDSVIQCKNAGINVIMVTGDNLNTAIAISKECDILNEKDVLNENFALNGTDFYTKVEGLECGTCFLNIKDCKCPLTNREAEFRGIDKNVLRKERIKNMKEFENIVKNLKVLARSRPIDKYALVIGLKAMNSTVAVTGDGTNDAQALSTSDIGFAMGIQGTDIAKDAADIIILDDNFSSIVNAIIWGRNIYDNIKKFIQFQLTVNLSALILVFITSLVSNETAISPIQMLWINLIIDSLGSLALSTQEPDSSILKRKPISKSESLIGVEIIKNIVINSITLITICLIVFFIGPSFIKESNTDRITEGRLIKLCFGYLPGENFHIKNSDYYINSDEYYIISGISSEWSANIIFSNKNNSNNCDKYVNSTDLSSAFIVYESFFSNTCHMTIIFNIFVIFTLFNQLNSRIIGDNLNIFSGITRSGYFLIILLSEFVLQVLIVQFGNSAFNTCRNGLTLEQWLISTGFASVSLVSNGVFKVIKVEILVLYLVSHVKRVFLKEDNVLNVSNDQLKENEEFRIRAYINSIQYGDDKLKRSERQQDSFEASIRMIEEIKKRELF